MQAKRISLQPLYDWQINDQADNHLTEEQRKPWRVEVEDLAPSCHDLLLWRPDGKQYVVRLEIENGNPRLHLFGPDEDDALAHLTMTDKGVFIAPAHCPAGTLSGVVAGENGITTFWRGQEPGPEPWAAGFVPLPGRECGVRVRDGVIEFIPMNRAGFLSYDAEPRAVVAPKQMFLDEVNGALGTSFTVSQFAMAKVSHCGAKWTVLPEFGSAIRLEEGVLLEIPLNADGTLDGEDAIGEVTVPESQEYLDAVNEALGTSFTMNQFAGR